METEKCHRQQILVREVINKGTCVVCGACVGLCPYFQYFNGRVVTMDNCESDTGTCLKVCPMAVQETNDLGIKAQRQANGSEIGPYENLFIARAQNRAVREKGQYGGVVSALLIHALERGIITSAVLTDKGDGASPSGISVNHREGVLACAGSRYTASGGLSALN